MSTQVNYREARRLRALDLKQLGWRQRQIAEALGVTEGAVSQWMRRAREGGEEGLRHRKPPGPKRRLSFELRARIPALLARGARAFGFPDDEWTCRRVAALVARELGVSLHPAHVSRVLRAL